MLLKITFIKKQTQLKEILNKIFGIFFKIMYNTFIMARITKIICTLGPACDNVETLNKMYESGMNIARLNMSHGTLESHQTLIDKLTDLRDDKGLKLLIDTKGPEIRIDKFKNDYIILNIDDIFTFTTLDILGDQEKVSLKYKELINEVKVGDKIYANNGMLVFEVIELTKTDIKCKVLFGGKLSNNKSLNIPNVVPNTPYLSDADKKDLLFAIKNKADFIALSFVSYPQNVIDVKKFLDENDGGNISLIAKIENAKGVENAEQILNVCDGIMVARGDLGVEIPLEKIPPIQKRLISLCNVKRKFCIVATEMLESMTNSTRPTRAEVSDVATAIYQETNATMLSGETASGINPVLVVQTMAKIIDEIEDKMYFHKL